MTQLPSNLILTLWILILYWERHSCLETWTSHYESNTEKQHPKEVLKKANSIALCTRESRYKHQINYFISVENTESSQLSVRNTLSHFFTSVSYLLSHAGYLHIDFVVLHNCISELDGIRSPTELVLATTNPTQSLQLPLQFKTPHSRSLPSTREML